MLLKPCASTARSRGFGWPCAGFCGAIPGVEADTTLCHLPINDMRDLSSFADIHTHRADAGDDAVISVEPGLQMRPDRWYSVGIHPWSTAEDIGEDMLNLLEDEARADNVVAIGECGLDALRGGSLERQEEIFKRHVSVSEELGKPLIVHCVKAYDRLIALRKQLKPRQRWIIHGFRGKPQLASDLLRHGFDLSFGEKYNPDTYAAVPAGRRFRETD